MMVLQGHRAIGEYNQSLTLLNQTFIFVTMHKGISSMEREV